MTLEELVRELARARKAEETARQHLAFAEEQMRNSDLGQIIGQALDMVKETSEARSIADSAVRDAAVATGDKRPHPAVEVKTYTVVTIEDEPRVIRWASQAAPNVLKLDRRAIEKAAKAVEIPGVKLSEERRASIASDLSEYANANAI